jgi:hypothetical protein
MMGDAFVRLDDVTRSDMAKQMARHWTVVEDLRAKKARDSKKTQDEIDEELEEIGRLCRVINDDGETKDQLSLFVPEEQAKAALAALAARQPDCTPVNARECPRHGTCSCERLEDETEGEAPAVKAIDCVLHGVDAPHVTEPPPQAEPEPAPIPPEEAEIQATAKAFVDSLNGTVPEGLGHTNHLLTGFFTATDVPRKRRARVRTAVDALLGAMKLPPANHGTSDQPAEGEPAGEEASA